MTEKMINTLTNRINEMLQNAEINAQYQSFENIELAQDWIIKAAIATLCIPAENR